MLNLVVRKESFKRLKHIMGRRGRGLNRDGGVILWIGHDTIFIPKCCVT